MDSNSWFSYALTSAAAFFTAQWVPVEYNHNWPGRTIALIGVPTYTESSESGFLTPSVLRKLKFAEALHGEGCHVIDYGDVKIGDENTPNSESYKSSYNRTLIAKALKERVIKFSDEQAFPLIIGGDRSASFGAISALMDYYPDLVILWMDCRSSLNSSESQNYSSATLILDVDRIRAMGINESVDQLFEKLQSNDSNTLRHFSWSRFFW